MSNRRAVFIHNLDVGGMPHALRNHQAINPIGRQVLHVAIEQTRAFTVQHPVAIANHRSNRRARSRQSALAHSSWQRPQLRMRIGVCRPRLQLVRNKELAHRDFVLVGMPRPRAIHQRIRFVFLVLGQNLQRSRVQFRVFAARIERGHAADRQHPVLVANPRHQVAQILEKGHVVWNRVAIGQHPLRIFQIEVNQAGHVVPAAQIQAENVITQIPGKLFHLKCQRMRFHQRHALDRIRRRSLQSRNHLEEIAPPQRFVRRFRFRNVNAQRMLQRIEVRLIRNHRHVKERCGQQFARQNSRLMQMQPARPRENYRRAGVDAHGLVAFAVKISEPPRKRF